jgi:Zn-dependent protease
MNFQNSEIEEFAGSNLVAPPPLPGHVARRSPAIDFYAVDSRKLRLREWWRSTGMLTALVGWAVGRVGANIAAGQRVPMLRDWQEAEISGEELPGDVREKFAARTAELREAGFRDPVFYHVVNRFNGYEDYAALLVGPSGMTLARILWARALPGGNVRKRFETGFLTAFGDGRYVWTCDQPPRFDVPPEVLAQHRRNAPVEELLRLHDEAVAAAGARPEPVRTPSQLWSVYTAYETADFRFNARRGLFTAPSAAEAANDTELANAERAAAAQGSRFGAAWAELQRAQTPKPALINGVLLLLVTILASATVGFGGVSGEFIALILGVLFFHELGHYVAMRVFKYRDVRMFFLPGFGAAVSGRHSSVAGWKKAVVSLLGPVPGIWAGAALGGYAIFAGSDPLAKIALMLMALNVFNLLPIVPLDGGWFWNSVLFSRTRWLEFVFKGFAGLCGIAASAAGLGRIWMFLGIGTLIALPGAWLQGRVASSLRRRGFVPAAGDDDSVPFETAEAIFGELDTTARGKFNAKTLATNALQIFERLNATPPNWLETLGLSAVYFVSIVAAVIGISFVTVFHYGPDKLAKAAADAAKKPEPAPVLDARFNGEYQHAPATQIDERTGTRFIIAQFASSDEAKRAYDQLAAEQAPTVDLAQFGQSVLVQVPAKKSGPAQKLTDALAQAGGKVSDDRDGNGWFNLNLAATAPSRAAASQVHHELDVWLRLPADLRPPAPWLGELDPAIHRACETYRKIEEAKTQAAQDPELRRRERQGMFTSIFHRGKNAFAQNRELAAARDRVQRDAVARLRATHDPALDDAVLAHELERPSFPIKDANAMKTWRAELRRLVTHQAPPAEEFIEDEDTDEVAINWRDYVSGEVELTQQTIILKDLNFGTPLRNLPALAEWLTVRGFTDLRYGVQTHTTRDYAESLGE